MLPLESPQTQHTPLPPIPSQTPQPPAIRYPCGGVRQRSSNISVKDPEFEFQKTALDSCRSKIIQQESEMKKLKEALDLRNKKVMQLEAQVNPASEFIANSDGSTPSTSLQETMLLVLSRIETLCSTHNQPVNNISINNHGSQDDTKRVSTSSQTVFSFPSVDNCEESSVPVPLLENHENQVHVQNLNPCNECDQ